MSKIEKLKIRLSSKPKDFTYSETRTLLISLGFQEYTKGRTSGSRVKFYRVSDQAALLLHKPHPGDKMCIGAIEDLLEFLKGLGELK